MSQIVSEAFQTLQMEDFDDTEVGKENKSGATFNFDKEGATELQNYIDSDKNAEDDSIDVVDPKAKTDDDLQDSYVDQVICQCTACGNCIVLSADDIIPDKENGIVNVEETCPTCFHNEGYKIIAQIMSDGQYVSTEEDEEEETDNIDADEIDDNADEIIEIFPEDDEAANDFNVDARTMDIVNAEDVSDDEVTFSVVNVTAGEEDEDPQEVAFDPDEILYIVKLGKDSISIETESTTFRSDDTSIDDAVAALEELEDVAFIIVKATDVIAEEDDNTKITVAINVDNIEEVSEGEDNKAVIELSSGATLATDKTVDAINKELDKIYGTEEEDKKAEDTEEKTESKEEDDSGDLGESLDTDEYEPNYRSVHRYTPISRSRTYTESKKYCGKECKQGAVVKRPIKTDESCKKTNESCGKKKADTKEYIRATRHPVSCTTKVVENRHPIVKPINAMHNYGRLHESEKHMTRPISDIVAKPNTAKNIYESGKPINRHIYDKHINEQRKAVRPIRNTYRIVESKHSARQSIDRRLANIRTANKRLAESRTSINRVVDKPIAESRRIAKPMYESIRTTRHTTARTPIYRPLHESRTQTSISKTRPTNYNREKIQERIMESRRKYNMRQLQNVFDNKIKCENYTKEDKGTYSILTFKDKDITKLIDAMNCAERFLKEGLTYTKGQMKNGTFIVRMRVPNKQLTEAFDDVVFTSGDKQVKMTSDNTGDVHIDIADHGVESDFDSNAFDEDTLSDEDLLGTEEEPTKRTGEGKNTPNGEAVAGKVSDELKDQIEQQEEDEDEIEEIEEESFNYLGKKFLTQIYDNVSDFKTSRGYVAPDGVVLEGLITFKDSTKRHTQFVLTPSNKTARGKYQFICENKDVSKKPLIVKGDIKNKKIIFESLQFRQSLRDKRTGEMKAVCKTFSTKR